MSEATEEDILAAALAAASRVTVVSGAPDDAEVAALVAGLAAVVGSSFELEDAVPAESQWQNRSRRLAGKPAHVPGTDAWRWSLHN
jgi:hypothetical protein